MRITLIVAAGTVVLLSGITLSGDQPQPEPTRQQLLENLRANLRESIQRKAALSAGPPDHQTAIERFSDLSRQYAETLSEEELQQEIAALEAKLVEAQARRDMERIRTDLEKLIQKYPGTGAARAAEEMLKQRVPTRLDQRDEEVFR